MARPLVIVESPAKAKTIEGFLGRENADVVTADAESLAGARVLASIGHIRDLPSSAKEVPKSITNPEVKRLAIDIDDHFSPIWVVKASKAPVVKQLKAALKDASELYLATDEDREGEAISWHVLEVLKPTVPVKRLVFHEITRDAINEAIENPRELDMKLVEAQTARRVLDRLFGYEMSLVTRRRAGGATSAGRVQSVAARLVVERERARMAFRAGSYWDLAGTFRASGDDFPAGLVAVDGRRLATGKDFDPATGRLAETADVALLDEATVVALGERLRDVPFRVDSVETKAMTERPKPPFTTSTLQQEAARKLGFSAARTMSVAQKLYENGFITYMRTDSTNLSGQALTAARRQISELYGPDYLPSEPRHYKGKVKNAQEAHEAIRPAGDAMRVPDEVAPELQGADERRLYDLVWKRAVASQMADARVRRVTARLVATPNAGDAPDAPSEVTFQASGRTIEFPGYLRAYVEGADDPDAELEDRETILPALAEGDAVECRELAPAGHTTQPPARYTEASLVKELEERGIGRPSTYASVIDTLLRRDYVWKKGSALVPSWTAFAKMQLFEQHFPHLIDYEFTATMEEALDVIARGEGEAEKWLHTFWFGNGQAGLRELCDEKHLESIDPAIVNALHIGKDADGREVIVRVWNNGANVEIGDKKAPVPVDLVPDELTVEKAEELIEKGSGGPRELGDRSGDRASRARTHWTLRSVRAARGDGGRQQGQAQARVAVLRPRDRHGQPRRGRRAALAAARRRRRWRRRRDHRAERSVRPVPEEGDRQPEPRDRGAAVHRHRGRGRSDLRPAQTPRRAHEAADCRARSAPRVGRPGARARRALRALRDRRDDQRNRAARRGSGVDRSRAGRGAAPRARGAWPGDEANDQEDCEEDDQEDHQEEGNEEEGVPDRHARGEERDVEAGPRLQGRAGRRAERPGARFLDAGDRIAQRGGCRRTLDHR